MRNAQEFVEDYRRKGYPDDRIRIIASMRPEPLRTEVLKLLDDSPAATATDAPAEDAAQQTAEPATVEMPFPPDLPPEKPAVSVATETSKEELKTVRAEMAGLQKERDKLAAQMRKTQNELDKERAKLKTELEKARAELATAKSSGAETQDLRKRAEEAESLRHEFDDIRTRCQSALEEGKAAQLQLAELQEALQHKESVLSQMEEMLSETQASAQEARAEREKAVERAGELAAKLEQQNDRLGDFDRLNHQFAKVSADAEELRVAANRLKESEQAKAERISELEVETGRVRDESAELRRQIEAHEQAVEDLQTRISTRESELESLRSHFDREASDLKKRAEQEVWLMQRRMRRIRQMTMAGGVAAAVLLAVATFGWIGERTDRRDAQQRLVALQQQQLPSLSQQQAQWVPPSQMPFTPASVSLPPTTVTTTVLVIPNPRPTASTVRLSATTTTTVRAAGGRLVTHRVAAGENLSVISQKYYGTANRWQEIAQANGIDPARPNIGIGQELKIPPR